MFSLLQVLSNSANKVVTSDLEKRSRSDVCKLYNNGYAWTKTKNLKCHVPPSTSISCGKFGTWAAEDQKKSLSRVNYFRQLCGLSTIKASSNSETMSEQRKGAIMMAANSKMQHTGWTSSHKCYTAAGAKATGSSNIASGYQCVGDSIPGYMDETNNVSPDLPLGHRNWIIDPALAEFAASIYGKYSLVRTFYFASTPKSYKKPTIWAYPAPGYFPMLKDFTFPIPTRWSMGFIGDKVPTDVSVSVKVGSTSILKKKSILNAYKPGYIMMEVNTQSLKSGSVVDVVISSKSKATTWKYSVKITDCTANAAENFEEINTTDYYVPIDEEYLIEEPVLYYGETNEETPMLGDPSEQEIPQDDDDDDEPPKGNGTKIAIIVSSVVAGLAVIAIIAFVVVKYTRRSDFERLLPTAQEEN